MWSDMSNHGGWWGFGPLPMLLFWVLVIVALVALGKWIFERSGDAPRGKTALDILKQRYAHGEIGKEEFDKKKSDLHD